MTEFSSAQCFGPSVCSIFRSGLTGSQMNSLSGATACYIMECHPSPATVGDADWCASGKLLLVDLHLDLCFFLFILLPKRPLLMISHTDGRKALRKENSAIDQGHQAWTTEFYMMLAMES